MNAVSPAPTFAPPTHRYTAAAVIVLVELLLIFVYWDTARAMVGIWYRSETFNHAFLVPLISLWLIWEKRHQLAGAVPQPTPWLLLPLAGLAFAWMLGELAAVNAVTQLAMVASMVLAVPLVLGVATARLILFPLLFLFFAVPIGEFVMPQLMVWTADVTVIALRLSGVSVYQDGLQFAIPTGRWSVVEACSGVRYLIASLTVGTLFAYLNYHSLKRRLIFMLVSLLVPIVANWGRAYMIVMLGHLSENKIAAGVDHLIYGWVFFGVVILIMFAIGMRWREPELERNAAVERAAASSARAATRMAPLALAALATLTIAATPRLFLTLESSRTVATPLLDASVLVSPDWIKSDGPPADWQPSWANPAATLNAALESNARKVGVFIAYYRQQNYDRKLISSDNVLVTSKNDSWAQVANATHDARIDGQRLVLRAAWLRSRAAMGDVAGNTPRLRVWQWYWIDGEWVISDHFGKLKLALARLAGRGDDSAAIFLYAREDVPGGADSALQAALDANAAGLRRLLDAASAQR